MNTLSTTIKPRPYQIKVLSEVKMAWSMGDDNVLAVAPTGAGKTIIKAFMAKYFYDRGEYCVIYAHRDVLLSQISMSLARVGLPHSFICNKVTERDISNMHVTEFGYSYVDTSSTIIVASVLTWVNRDTTYLSEIVKGWMLDEAHHLTADTSWHNCVKTLVNAKGMGVTATPLRADKKGLGSDCGGVFDSLVLAPTMGELIEMGSLSPYRIYTVPSRLDTSTVNVTSSGDYNQKKLALLTDNADITGDAVEHYLRLANGQQAITFCVNIEHAKHVSKQFNDAGIPSVALSSKSKLAYRQQKLKEFKSGVILNLINVDLFGEGFDVPACSVVIMLRKTMSYGLFKQQFGRMLRVFEGKDYGILLDHVGNIREHCVYGAPHDDPEWSLEPQKKKKKVKDDKGINSRTCPKCFGFYQPKSNSPKSFICPYCNHAESEDDIITAAKEIQVAEGVLTEYDCSYITGLIQRRKDVDMPVEDIKSKHRFSPDIVKFSAAKNHLKRQEAQRKLRERINLWCEHTAVKKMLDVQTTQSEFERVFGVNVFKAQVLSERLALELLDKIQKHV
jgi:superfamily II DNA or RNA helicase